MGQYYKAILLDKEKKNIVSWVSPYQYESGSKLMEHSWMENNFVKSFENMIYKNPMPVVWAGDYADPENGLDEGPNLFEMREDKTNITPTTELGQHKSRYVINHDTKEYVDKESVPKDKDGRQIHPLPLLTCEGNGRGGGDFRGDSELVGSWSRCLISVSEELPEGYTELEFDLVE
jgi:hypothetical protein